VVSGEVGKTVEKRPGGEKGRRFRAGTHILPAKTAQISIFNNSPGEFLERPAMTKPYFGHFEVPPASFFANFGPLLYVLYAVEPEMRLTNTIKLL